MAIDIGLIAYNEYIKQIGGNHHFEWSKIGKVQQDAWRHAAVAVSQYLHQERERMDKEDPDDPIIA